MAFFLGVVCFSMARLIAFSQLAPKPWKNGGGSTTELLVYPETADLESFVWRVSIAQVAQDGPFSHFHGIDRTLVLLRGTLMTLDVENLSEVRLTAESPIYQFPGELAIMSAVPEGPTTDFNVMTRRSVCRHSFERKSVQGSLEVECRGRWTLILLASGDSMEAVVAADHFSLRLFDALVVEGGDCIHLAASAATAFVVSIDLLE